MPKPRQLYRIEMNWQGEVHIFYTWANSPLVAKCYAMQRLSKKIERGITFLDSYFNGSKDNFTIKEVQSDKD